MTRPAGPIIISRRTWTPSAFIVGFGMALLVQTIFNTAVIG